MFLEGGEPRGEAVEENFRLSSMKSSEAVMNSESLSVTSIFSSIPLEQY